MLINHERKFIYLAIPRTGSTSITRGLFKHFEGSIKAGHHRMDVPEHCRDYFIFTTVRNPYHRILSHYRHRHKHYKDLIAHWSFACYVHAICYETMGRYKLNNDPPAVRWPNASYHTHFYKIEELNSNWKALPIWDYRGPLDLKILNKSEAHQGGAYDQQLADEVYAYYRGVFDQFDYDRDSWLGLASKEPRSETNSQANT